jgi:hypothetical protein
LVSHNKTPRLSRNKQAGEGRRDRELRRRAWFDKCIKPRGLESESERALIGRSVMSKRRARVRARRLVGFRRAQRNMRGTLPVVLSNAPRRQAIRYRSKFTLAWMLLYLFIDHYL